MVPVYRLYRLVYPRGKPTEDIFAETFGSAVRRRKTDELPSVVVDMTSLLGEVPKRKAAVRMYDVPPKALVSWCE